MGIIPNSVFPFKRLILAEHTTLHGDDLAEDLAVSLSIQALSTQLRGLTNIHSAYVGTGFLAALPCRIPREGVRALHRV